MSSKSFLGSISPAYGIATGEGAIGKAAGKGLLGLAPYMIAKDAKKSDEESSRGAVGRAAGKSGKAEPQEGAPETGRPRGRGMLSRIPMSAVNSKSMRGASTQGMKDGGKVKNYRDGGIYTAGMGQPPQDIDGGSAPPKKAPAPKKQEAKKPAPKKPVQVKKFAKGGSIDGCAVKGKTRASMQKKRT